LTIFKHVSLLQQSLGGRECKNIEAVPVPGIGTFNNQKNFVASGLESTE
jgi:hypothetical protein